MVNELFEWDPICEYMPLQAIGLKIDGIKDLEIASRLLRIPHIESPAKRIENFLWDHLYFNFEAEIM